jgi:hypothetical protein
MSRYAIGQPVIVTSEDKHQVGVVVETFIHNNSRLYDILFESRSAISAINSSSSRNTYINRELTKKLCDTGIITPTIDYDFLFINEMLPITRC